MPPLEIMPGTHPKSVYFAVPEATDSNLRKREIQVMWPQEMKFTLSEFMKLHADMQRLIRAAAHSPNMLVGELDPTE